MHLIFLGPPGVGKGTLAAKLQEKKGFVQISTGEMLRGHLRAGDALGQAAKQYIDRGELVPDAVIIDMVKERLNQPDVRGGYILDGFPRTVAQADALAAFATIDRVVSLELEKEKIVARLSGRRVCPACGGTFHTSMLNGSDLCPVCGHTVEQRKDDAPETVANRLDVYERQTAPLLDYYRQKGSMVSVRMDGSVDDNFTALLDALHLPA